MKKIFRDREDMYLTISGIFLISLLILSVSIVVLDNLTDTVKIRYEDCTVIEKYVSSDTTINVSMSMLAKYPVLQKEGENYMVVVMYKEQKCPIKVKKNLYSEIKVGETVKCIVEDTFSRIFKETTNYNVVNITGHK